MFEIATTYQNYKENEQNVTVSINNATISVNNDNVAIYGPIQITYNYIKSYEANFGGFNYAFFDSNDNNVTNKVILCDDKYQPIINADLDNDGEADLDSEGYYHVQTTEYNNKNLYIKYNWEDLSNLTNIKMKIQENVLDIEATVYQIVGTETITKTTTDYCETCRLKGPGYYCAYCGTTSYNRNQNPDQRKAEGIEHFLKHPYYFEDSQPYGQIKCYCNLCGNFVFETYRGGVNPTNDERYSHAAKHISLRYGCGLNNCGRPIDAGTTCTRQPLSILYNYTVTKGTEQIGEINFNVIPPINITLGKYNSTGETELTGAKFEIVAIQNEQEIFKASNVLANEIKNIIPKSFDDVYVTITETEAPNGYIKLNEPIRARYTYNSSLKTWAPSYVLDGWSWVDDGNTSLPNTYESTSGDRIYVNEQKVSGVHQVFIDVYNDAVIEKLTLLKVDANELTTQLEGAIFKGTITNIKSFKYGGSVVKDNITNNTYSFEYTLTSGRITLEDVVLADENANVVITLEEVQVPIPKDENNNIIYDYYYKQLEGTITVILKHNTSGGFTLVSFSYSGPEEVTLNGNKSETSETNMNSYEIAITIPNERVIDINGKVWLDGQTGLKDVQPANGIKDSTELGIPGVKVQLYQQSEEGPIKIKETYTDNDGKYEFKEVDYGNYYNIVFEYDGIHYEATTTKNGSQSLAKEDTDVRNSFNYKFQTIEYDEDKKAVVATNINKTLVYVYENGESKLCTYYDADGNYTYLRYKNGVLNTLDADYAMQASTQNLTGEYTRYISTKGDVNFGLVGRSTDLELTTDVYDAKVLINGEETTYQYNREDNSINVGNSTTSEENSNEVEYLEIYESDYNYRIRDYITNSDFNRSGIMNPTSNENSDMDTGSELEVYIIYKVELQNQGATDGYINKIKYRYSSKYIYDEDLTMEYNNSKSNGITTFNIQNSKTENDSTICDISFYRTEEGETKQGIEVTSGQSKILYLAFRVNKDSGGNLITGNFPNTAEIMSYSTDDGYTDKDSQPGNYFFGDESGDNSNNQGDGNNNQDEDDDSIAEININVPIGGSSNSSRRKISGTVYNQDNNKLAVDDVIVQLIELKEYTGAIEALNGKTIEYIWQETVSGSGRGKRINSAGTALEEYTYTKETGKYEFQNFIPGDYIVRFIYGDGTSYDLTNNITKYNGQDYKSMANANYNAEWYNNSGYTEGASVARDNEARRLQTMAYSVNVDAKKGILLKLLDYRTFEQLNETEKEKKVEEYNSRCTEQSDYIQVNDLTDNILINLFFNETEKETLKEQWELTEITADTIENLLKSEALKNTWMCAETSKIKVTVDNATATVFNTNIPENATGQASFTNINLGLTKRPETRIELKKYVTGFKLTASNGQVLVNASIDKEAARESGNIDEYLTNLDNVNGIKNNLVLLDTVWQYEVSPTEVNTVVEGAKLEYEYTLVVKNTGMTDYLSTTLENAYNGEYEKSVMLIFRREGKELNYKNVLEYYMELARTKSSGYTIGKYLGTAYYTGNVTKEATVQTEVTSIRDYLNNNLTFISGIDSNGNPVTEVKDGENNAILTHHILRDEHGMQDIKVNYLKTESTGKMSPKGDAVLYAITLGREPISATSEISFENYIAEVMSYTNAAGRRATTSTPGNAEIIDAELREGRVHEEDEADTGRIQIGAKTGEDEQTNYTLITAIAAGIVLIAVGAFVTKKYVIK